jgi:transposase
MPGWRTVSLVSYLGKNSFHFIRIEREGFYRRPKFRIFGDIAAMEIGSAARKLEELGHSPKLISPQFVRPFVKSNKNDFVDAEAICEAASRPSMRLCSPERNLSSNGALHRVRESLVQDKVKTTNQMGFCWNLAPRGARY